MALSNATCSAPGHNTAYGTASVVLTYSAGPPSADLSIAKQGSPSGVAVGGDVTYTLTVDNHGPDDATGVIVADGLPRELRVVSVTGSNGAQCAHSSTIAGCRIASLGSGAETSVTLVAPAVQTGRAVDVAGVIAAQHDPNPGNNVAWATTLVHR